MTPNEEIFLTLLACTSVLFTIWWLGTTNKSLDKIEKEKEKEND